jgi:hypothetical protein
MKTENLLRIFRATLALACITAHGADTTPVLPAATPNDNARFLAGLPPDANSPLSSLTKTQSWQEHAKFFDKAWDSLDKRQLSKIATWTQTYLGAPSQTCFYMFSGPDYLYANAFFPNAKTYVLCGLEPVGALPDAGNLKNQMAALENLQRSLNTVLAFSFFKTKDMKSDLHNEQLGGTLPILYVFLARSGKTIQSVDLVSVDKDGNETAGGGKGATSGVKIVFSGAAGGAQTLYYFSSDLSNDGIAHSGFIKFCERLGTGDSIVKSASYLMHSDAFSSVRKFLLEHTATLAQDDSGIPVSFFDQEKWTLRLFGKYLGPIPLFKEHNQEKLAQLYSTSHPPELEFGIGYRWYPTQSNWLVAVRKTAQAAN